MNKTKVYDALIQSTCFSMAIDRSDYLGYLKVLRWENTLKKKNESISCQKGKRNIMFKERRAAVIPKICL